MTLSVVCPKEWRTISNGQDTRYENANQQGKRILEKYDTAWFMGFYDDGQEVSAYEFE
jgi:hypothetical protein